MPYADNRGVKIHYRQKGDGETAIILLHGLGASGSCWFSLPQRLQETLSKNTRVLSIDNRGTGFSDKPLRPWSIGDMADDVAAVINSSGTQKGILVGLSMGGMIAQHVALRHSNLVSGLVLMATTPGLPYTRHPNIMTLKMVAQLPKARGEKARELFGALLLPEKERPYIATHMEGWRELLLKEGASPRCFLMQLGAIATHQTWLKHRKIKCPTQILVGEEDAFLPTENSDILKRLIPHAKLKRLPGIAHSIDILGQNHIIEAISEIV